MNPTSTAKVPKISENKQKYQKAYRSNPINAEKARLANIEYAKNEKRIAYRKEYRKRVKEEVAKEYQDLKLKVHETMGGKCCKCGFKDSRALQIDHIKGDGFQDKKDGNYNGKKHLVQVLLSVMNKEKRFQLLCANCNWIKRFDNNEHYKR